MTTEFKRRRGRPPGTGNNADLLLLAKVADLLMREPGLTPTSAMHRLRSTWPGRETDVTLLRRWQGKWKIHGVELRAAALARQDAERARRIPEDRVPARDILMGLPASVVAQLAEQLMPLHKRLAKQGVLSDMMMTSPVQEAVLAAAAAQLQMPIIKDAIAHLNRPEVRTGLNFMNSPAGKAAQAVLRAHGK